LLSIDRAKLESAEFLRFASRTGKIESLFGKQLPIF